MSEVRTEAEDVAVGQVGEQLQIPLEAPALLRMAQVKIQPDRLSQTSFRLSQILRFYMLDFCVPGPFPTSCKASFSGGFLVTMCANPRARTVHPCRASTHNFGRKYGGTSCTSNERTWPRFSAIRLSTPTTRIPSPGRLARPIRDHAMHYHAQHTHPRFLYSHPQ